MWLVPNQKPEWQYALNPSYIYVLLYIYSWAHTKNMNVYNIIYVYMVIYDSVKTKLSGIPFSHSRTVAGSGQFLPRAPS
jgi:hypothetical protein